MKFPKFIVHDVLQLTDYKPPQGSCIQLYGSFAKMFMENMKPFEGHPTILACLSEGVGQTELVNHIKAHPEWDVQCHGTVHRRYDKMPYNELVATLRTAKSILENVFEKPVTEFYPPYFKYNSTTEKACAEVGMREHRPKRRPNHYKKIWGKCAQVDFHFWNHKELPKVYFILRYFTVRPLYIIGCPRSGTTAFMRLMAQTNPEVLALKEIEKIWHNGTDIRAYYAQKLVNSGKENILDKNVRNTMRIPLIREIFPDAKFIHLIRDGRAASHSWRKWAIKTKKPDQTLAGAIQRWITYVTCAQEQAKSMSDGQYEEIRYENICQEEDYMVSRNFKWQKEMTPAEKLQVVSSAGPLLRKLGYLK